MSLKLTKDELDEIDREIDLFEAYGFNENENDDCWDTSIKATKGNEDMKPLPPYKQNFVPNVVEQFWETGIEMISSCGTAPSKVDVAITPDVSSKFRYLMSRFPGMEWLAYLVGTNDENGIIVEDIIIPKQKVSVVSVNVIDSSVDQPIIGVIHSHHDMGNSFSHTDDEYINQNHDISLCISKSGIQGDVRIKTACGKYVAVKANVVDSYKDELISDLESQIKDNIKVNQITTRYPRITGGVRGGVRGGVNRNLTTPTPTQRMIPEPVDIIGKVTDYYSFIKDIKVGGLDDGERIVEMSLVIDIINNIETGDYTHYSDMFINSTVIFTGPATDLVDEIDSCEEFSEAEVRLMDELCELLAETINTFESYQEVVGLDVGEDVTDTPVQ